MPRAAIFSAYRGAGIRDALRAGRFETVTPLLKEIEANGQRLRVDSECAPFHSITSSARASSVGGTSRPSALAVLRLITSSYFEACSTGRSAGLAPLRILST
jgi:hypothetical protein